MANSKEVLYRNDMPRGWISKNSINTKIYRMWRSMWSRVLSKPGTHNYKYYHNVVICEEWRLLSNFVNWVISQNNYDKFIEDPFSFSLDKDIKSDSKKLYSPSTCALITFHDNKKYSRSSCEYYHRYIIGIKNTDIILLKRINDCKHLGMNDATIAKCASPKYYNKTYKGYKWYYIKINHNMRLRVSKNER